MRPAPDGLRLDWTPAGVTVALRPLAGPEAGPREAVSEAWGLAVLGGALPVPLLVLGQALFALPDGLPPAAMALGGALGLLAGLALAARRAAAHLSLHIEPDRLVLVHRLGALRLVTEELPYDAIQRVRLEDRTLIVALGSGRVVHEPLPALSDGARTWILELVQEARRAHGAFRREELSAAERAGAIHRLTARVSSTR